MKKIYLLFALMITGLSIAQTPIITMIADGDETGGNPKVLEIYAQGTVNFADYSLENQTNSSTTWGNTFDLSPLGTVTDDFVYVYYEGNGGTANPGSFANNYPGVAHSLEASGSSVLSINGDDRVRIINTSTTAVVDTFGADGVDGTGTPWEYKDGYAKRLNGTGPDPVFVEASWEYHKADLDHHGFTQDGTTYASIIGLGTYTPSTSTAPALAITSPTPNQVFDPTTTDVDVVFSIQNFNVANGTGDGNIQWKLDNAASWTAKYDVNPIQLTGLAPGTHTVDMKLVDNSGQDLSPAVEASVTFEIAVYTVVADLATLRTSPLNGYYQYSGEVFATGGYVSQSGNLTGFAQDANNVGIMAFALSGVIQTQINDGDGMTDLKGQLVDYHGVLELKILEDITATGNNQTIAPQVITADELNTNHEDYESELIEIDNATVANTGTHTDTNFTTGHNYDLTDASGTTTLRAQFSDLDEALPAAAANVVGIASEYNTHAQIFPRGNDDVTDVPGGIDKNNIEGFKVYPNPVSGDVVFVSSNNNVEKQVVIYDVLGKIVLKTATLNNVAINVSQLKAGIYLMKVKEDNHVAVQQLIVK